MPLYEYKCRQCGNNFSWLVGVVSDPSPPTCSRCGAVDAERREVSRFARARSIEISEDTDMDDPRAMERWAGEMGSELGEDLGDDFGEYAEDAAAGDDDSEGW